VRVWDVAQRKESAKLSGTTAMTSVAFAPDGKTLAAGGLDNSVWLWDATNWQAKPRPLTGHTERVNAVAFSPDSQRLASGSEDRTARIWEVATGTCQATLTGHEREVLGVAFSPDKTTLATGSADRTARLWDVATGQEKKALR